VARKNAPLITYAYDPDGTRVALVPLANSDQPARVLPEDLAEWRARGLSLLWTVNPNGRSSYTSALYVRAGCSAQPGCLATVARAIARAAPGQAVKYRDGNPRNLRRDNLYVTPWPRATRELPPQWQLPGYRYQPPTRTGRARGEDTSGARPA